ncbi:acid protease [Marasmius fiardii PR-910]|nr:acid protease [Marasmius fiardii PR-910]
MLSLSTICFFLSFSQAIPLYESLDLQARNDVQLGSGGFSLPIQRTKVKSRKVGRRWRRQDVSGATGLGNNNDLLYTVPIELGGKVTAVHLDTGSSDLWAITEQCTADACAKLSSFTHPLTSNGLNLTNTPVVMHYGDSLTGTSATGTVAIDTATIAGIAITNQPFGAIRATTNTVVQFGAAGIFGLGFPSGSEIQEAIVSADTGSIVSTDSFVKSTWKSGPLLSRISMTHMLQDPMFAIQLQRSTIDISGDNGQLTIGKLPDGVDSNSITWVPVKLYTPAEGGLKPPSFAANETYPFRWEIDIDGVFLDGKRIADSTIPVTGGVNATRVTALIDTGNSLIRGPSDVVDNILGQVSPNFKPGVANSATFPCQIPHKLAFQIGGKMFPIDPRDFIGEGASDATTCVADNLVETDAPGFGATFRWSLGDPFFKSNLVAFHYGNLTNPSVDPPRIGLMSRVPADADAKLTTAVNDAKTNGGVFENTIQIAPTDSAATAAQVTVSDDPNRPSQTSVPTNNNGAGASSTSSSSPVVTIGMDGPNGGSKKNSASSTVFVQTRGVVVAVVGVVLGSVFQFAW